MSRHDVYVDDNYYLDADERRHLGSFDTLEAAIAACRDLVEGWLTASWKADMRPEALLNRYYNFGPDPFVRTTEPHDHPPFSAWTYAEARAPKICAERGGRPVTGDRIDALPGRSLSDLHPILAPVAAPAHVGADRPPPADPPAVGPPHGSAGSP